MHIPPYAPANGISHKLTASRLSRQASHKCSSKVEEARRLWTCVAYHQGKWYTREYTVGITSVAQCITNSEDLYYKLYAQINSAFWQQMAG